MRVQNSPANWAFSVFARSPVECADDTCMALGPAITPPDSGDRIRAILGLRMPHSTRCDMDPTDRSGGQRPAGGGSGAGGPGSDHSTARELAPSPWAKTSASRPRILMPRWLTPRSSCSTCGKPWELEKFGTREGYINIPLAELEDRLDELSKDKTILTA